MGKRHPAAQTPSVALNHELPEGWSLTSLGEVTRPSSEKIEPQERPNAPYLSLEHIESQSGRILGYGKGSDVKSTKSVFRVGDVLYGKLRPYLNKVSVPDFDGICSTDILVFSRSPWLESRYLSYFLSRADVVEFANHHSAGVQLPRIHFDKLAELPFPLPPLAEQKRIVAKVEELVSRVNAARQRLARGPAMLKRFRQSVLAAACSGRLTAECSGGACSDNDLPETWKRSTIGEIATVCVGGTPSRKEPAYWNGDLPWVSSGEVANCRIWATRERITREGLGRSNAKMYPPGTVLIAMIGEGKTRGQTAILDIGASTNQNIADASLVEPEYIWRWAMGEYENHRSDSRGGNYPALNARLVREFIIPLPPLAEQREIVRRVESLFKLADAIEKRVAAATQRADKLTQAILAKAFRGELVPTEAELARIEDRDYEPASALLERIRREQEPKPSKGKRSTARNTKR